MEYGSSMKQKSIWSSPELKQQRKEIKLRLVSQRTVMTTDGYKPLCAYCNEPIFYQDPDMHEAIITRGDVQASGFAPLIMIDFNCVLVHPGNCHKMAATKVGQKKCISHLIRFEGVTQIQNWLLSMVPFFQSQQVADAIRLFNLVLEESNGKE